MSKKRIGNRGEGRERELEGAERRIERLTEVMDRQVKECKEAGG